MTALLYDSKIKAATPTMDISDSVDMVEFGDGYTQRVNKSINPHKEKWNVEWIGLTTTEAKTLITHLKSYQATALSWTSPLSDGDKLYTTKSIKAVPTTVHHNAWDVSCELNQQFGN